MPEAHKVIETPPRSNQDSLREELNTPMNFQGKPFSTSTSFNNEPQSFEKSTMGILEYLSQSNNNADCVSIEDRFKFIDDLSILEIINLLTIGISSINLKQHVPNDVPLHNQFIPSQNLESQKWLDEISTWTKNQKMKINEQKTKAMIFNFTENSGIAMYFYDNHLFIPFYNIFKTNVLAFMVLILIS